MTVAQMDFPTMTSDSLSLHLTRPEGLLQEDSFLTRFAEVGPRLVRPSEARPSQVDTRKKFRVMVVSDNDQVRRRLENTSDSNQYELIDARGGNEVVERGRASRIDMLIVDVFAARIPAQRLLQLLGLPGTVRVVMLSDSPVENTAATDERESVVIEKTISDEELRERVNGLLSGTKEQKPTLLSLTPVSPTYCFSELAS